MTNPFDGAAVLVTGVLHGTSKGCVGGMKRWEDWGIGGWMGGSSLWTVPTNAVPLQEMIDHPQVRFSPENYLTSGYVMPMADGIAQSTLCS